MGPGWVKNEKKGYFHTSHLTPNPVFPQKEVLKSPESPNTLKDKLTGPHKTLQKKNGKRNGMEKDTCHLKVLP